MFESGLMSKLAAMHDWKRFIRFGAVGALNTLWGYLIFAGLIFAGIGYVIASLLTIVVSILVSFFTQGRFVFGHLSGGAFRRFVLVWLIIYLAYLGVLTIGHALGLNSYIGGLLAIPVIGVLSYVLQRRFVFNHDRRMPVGSDVR